jgi:hypothetical protein
MSLAPLAPFGKGVSVLCESIESLGAIMND